MHLVSRTASLMMNKQKQDAIMDQSLTLLLSRVSETLLSDQPSNIRRDMEENYIQSLNRAESYYSNCREYLIKDDELSENAAVSKFAMNIQKLQGLNVRSTDTIIIDLVVKMHVQMNIERLLKEAEKQITI